MEAESTMRTRRSDLALRVEYKGQEIFKGPHTVGKRDEIYFCNTMLRKPGDSPEDFQ